VGEALKGEPETGCHPRVSGLGCWYGYRVRFGNQARGLCLNLSTRTRCPTAETRDLETDPPLIIRSPVSLCSTVFPAANRYPL